MTVTYASSTLALDVFVTNYSCSILNKRSGLCLEKIYVEDVCVG